VENQGHSPVFFKLRQPGQPIFIIEKGCRAIIATLGHMVRVSWSDYASYSWHEARVQETNPRDNWFL
jgi:hypothetical protein